MASEMAGSLLSRRALLTLLALSLIAVSAGIEAANRLATDGWSIGPPSVSIAARALMADRAPNDQREPSPGPASTEWQAIGPGYALVLFGIANIDRRVAAAVECYAFQERCDEDRSFVPVVLVQLAVAVLGMILVFATAWRLSASWEVAMLTLLLVFLATRLGDFAAIVRPAIWLPFLTYLAFYLTAESIGRGNVLASIGAGMAIGVASLFMPQWIVMAPVAAVAVAIFLGARGRRLPGVANGAAVLLGASVAGILTLYAQSLGYDPDALLRQMTAQLSERAAFQAMDLKAWLASLIIPVPLIGWFGELLFGEETTRLFGLWSTGSYSLFGAQVIYRDALENASTPLGQYGWVVDIYIWEQFGSYLWTNVSIANRGIWAGAGLIGLAGLFHVRPMLVRHWSDSRFASLAVVTLPIVVLFVVQVLLTANHLLNNPGLPFLYCYAIAYVSARL